MTNTKKQKNTNKKTMKGKGLWSSYKAPQNPQTTSASASLNQPCQSQLVNKNETQARPGIKCTDPGTTCLTSTGGLVKESIKPMWSWGQTDVNNKYKGTCQPDQNQKSYRQRVWKETKNTVQGSANAVLRSKDLAKMCGFIPSIQKTESGLVFSKNLWRNLKRNMCILASIPSNQLQTLITDDSNSQQDMNNILTRMTNHGININPSDFTPIKEDDPQQTDNPQQPLLPPGSQMQPGQGFGGKRRKQSNKKNKRSNKSQRSKKNRRN